MATASSLDSVAEVEDLLTCSICSETLNEPRSLHCFHNFCKVCLGKYVDRLRGPDKDIEIFPCPTCRSEFPLKSNQDVTDLASNYFIKNMLDIMAIQRQAKVARCSSCQGTAVNRCMTCEMFMCEKCSNSHAMWPVMKDHDVLSVEELSNPQSQVKMSSKLYCLKHKDEILAFYCETCKELSCLHCMVLNHIKQNHSCVSVEEIAQKQREILQGSCATLDEKLSAGKEALNAISEVMKSLETNAKDTKDQINAQKDKILMNITEKLEKRATKLAQDVDKVYGELHGQLNKQHGEIKDYLDKVQASVSLPRNLLKRGSIEEILSSQKLIDENIEKLGNEQPESLAPVNDGGIQYVPEDIGNINYDGIVNILGGVQVGPTSANKPSSERSISIEQARQREKLRLLDARTRPVYIQTHEACVREQNGPRSPVSPTRSDVAVRRIMRRKDSGSIGDDDGSSVKSVESVGKEEKKVPENKNQINRTRELRKTSSSDLQEERKSPGLKKNDDERIDHQEKDKLERKSPVTKEAKETLIEKAKSVRDLPRVESPRQKHGENREAAKLPTVDGIDIKKHVEDKEKRPERKSSESRPRSDEAFRKKSLPETEELHDKADYESRKEKLDKRGNRLSSKSERGSSESVRSRDSIEKRKEDRRQPEDIKRKREDFERNEQPLNEQGKRNRERDTRDDRPYNKGFGRLPSRTQTSREPADRAERFRHKTKNRSGFGVPPPKE